MFTARSKLLVALTGIIALGAWSVPAARADHRCNVRYSGYGTGYYRPTVGVSYRSYYPTRYVRLDYAPTVRYTRRAPVVHKRVVHHRRIHHRRSYVTHHYRPRRHVSFSFGYGHHHPRRHHVAVRKHRPHRSLSFSYGHHRPHRSLSFSVGHHRPSFRHHSRHFSPRRHFGHHGHRSRSYFRPHSHRRHR